MSDPSVILKPAEHADADRLTEIVQTCFLKAPEWRAPRWLIRRWWRGLMHRKDCSVLCMWVDSVHQGFIIYVADENTWDQIESSGPNRKIVKLLVLLTRPSVLRARLDKRRRLHQQSAEASHAVQQASESPATENPDADRWHDAEFFAGLMAIDPACRSRGLGTRMLQACEDLARERGSDLVRIYADPRNKRAHALYERLGYRHAGHARGSLVMTKRLQG